MDTWVGGGGTVDSYISDLVIMCGPIWFSLRSDRFELCRESFIISIMVFLRGQITRFARNEKWFRIDIICFGPVFLLRPETACLRISELATRKNTIVLAVMLRRGWISELATRKTTTA